MIDDNQCESWKFPIRTYCKNMTPARERKSRANFLVFASKRVSSVDVSQSVFAVSLHPTFLHVDLLLRLKTGMRKRVTDRSPSTRSRKC